MKKTIWIINQYASHLTTRHEELSRVFAAAGYRVAVITSSFHHGSRKYIYDEPLVCKELCSGVSYFYLHSGPSYSTNGAGRILNMVDFCRLVEKYRGKIAQHTGAPGFIIASSASPFVWETGYRTAKKYGAKFIAELRDIWPLSLVEIQGVSPGHPFVRLLGIIEKRAYNRAAVVVATLPYAWKHITAVTNVPREKVYWMPNGINTQTTDEQRSRTQALPEPLNSYLSSHWCCVYIGSFVKSECLDFMVDAIGPLQEEDICFAIIGYGHEEDNIRTRINEKGYKNIKIFPYIDKSLIPAVLEKAGCCVAAHDNIGIYRYGLSMNKLSDYLYSGKPVVFAYSGESVVKEAGGFAVPHDEGHAMAETIKRIKGMDEAALKQIAASERETILRRYDYKAIGTAYLEMLEGLQ